MKTEKLSEEIKYVDKDFLISDDISSLFISDQPFRMAGSVMCFCLRGSLTLKINMKKYVVSVNQILAVIPMQILQYIECSPDFECRIMVVSIKKFLDNFELELRPELINLSQVFSFSLQVKENPVITLNDLEVRNILGYYTFLSERMDALEDIYRKKVVYYIFRAFVLEWGNLFYKKNNLKPKSKRSRKNELFGEFMFLVEKYYKTERRVDFYAQKLSVTPKHLSTSIKEVSGELAGKWISKCVIMEAKVLLRSTTLTVQQISDNLNFANQSFFGKYFKHYMNISPNEYRTKLEEDVYF